MQIPDGCSCAGAQEKFRDKPFYMGLSLNFPALRALNFNFSHFFQYSENDVLNFDSKCFRCEPVDQNTSHDTVKHAE